MISHDETLDWSTRWRPESGLCCAPPRCWSTGRGPIYCISQLTPRKCGS